MSASYGERFRVIRESLGLSQTQFADRVTASGFTLWQTQVSRHERDSGAPLRLDAVEAISKTFEIPPTAFFVDYGKDDDALDDWARGYLAGLVAGRNAVERHRSLSEEAMR